jgi:hypothetical protein
MPLYREMRLQLRSNAPNLRVQAQRRAAIEPVIGHL